MERASIVESFPEAGRIVPDRIIYRQTEDSVEILTVHHSARLLDRSQFEAG